MNDADKRILLLERKKAILESRDALIPFARYMSPDPDMRADATRSTYEIARHHRVIAAALEEVEAGRIRRLMISVPPRHGKTRLASMLFPAWFLGRNPLKSIVFATYNDKYATDIGSVVKTMIQGPLYGHIFPDVKLIYGGASSDRLRIAGGGDMFCVGVGGTLTGRGGDCLSPDTAIHTVNGLKRIADVQPGDWVSSYDFGTANQVYARVTAVARRPRSRLFRVALASGRVVEATGDHRFAVGGEWKETRRLACGDPLLRDVLCDLQPIERRSAQTSRQWLWPFLLLGGLRKAWTQRSAVWRTDMSAVRETSSEGDIVWHVQGRAHFLFSNLHRDRTAGGVGSAGAHPSAALRALQSVVHAARQSIEVLLHTLQKSGALSRYGWRRQPALEGWGDCGAYDSPQSTALQRNASVDPSSGRSEVRFMPFDEQSRRSPYQRGPDRQSRGKSGDSLPVVSSEDAFIFRGRQDFVVSVTDTCRDSVVYDIEVAGTQCFFAAGVLVHNCNIIDDPIKNRQESDSIVVRDKLWNWYQSVFRTRMMTKEASLVIISTRWNEDDLIGRHIDPTNPHFNQDEADTWRMINLPALAEDDDPLGRPRDEPLWPSRFDLKFLQDQHRSDVRGFSALYQGRPTPAEGAFFKSDHIRTYNKMSDLPHADGMRFYGSSDFAVSTKSENDKSCHLVVGVDENDNLWIMPDIVWSRMPTDMSIDAVLHLMAKYHPMMWWGEKGVISKSIGPFLRKRMMEKRIYCSIDEMAITADKQARAQSIAARMAMGRVYYPRFARWFADAREQILKFPHSGFDDFVDALSLIGLGLMKQVRARNMPTKTPDGPREFTLGWVKENTKRAEREARLDNW